MRKCNYGVLKPVSADKIRQERRDGKHVPVRAALVPPHLRTPPAPGVEDWGLPSQYSLVTSASRHKPAWCKQQVQSWTREKTLKSPPWQFREPHTPFTLGHAASHPVYPQRGKGSRVGCSRPYLPCTSLLYHSGSFALCGKAISYAFTRAEHRDGVISPLQHRTLPHKWLMCLGQNTDLHVFACHIFSFCVSSLPSLQVSSLQLLITVPELAVTTTHSGPADGKPATLHDLIQLIPEGL